MSNNELRLDPNEQISLRYRLFARAIRINGSAQIRTLQVYLQSRLTKTFECLIEPQLHNGSMYLVCEPRANVWSFIQIRAVSR